MSAQHVLFTTAARESQSVFRQALQALARPGSVYQLPEVRPFPRLEARYGYALLSAVADHEVSIAVTGASDAEAAFASLGTGARPVPPEEADYVLALADDPGLPRRVQRGLPDTPELGATLIVVVRTVGAGGLALGLTGPGVASSASLSVTGLVRETVLARNEACAEYPLGIDLLVVDGDGRLAGIPRTTNVTLEAN